MAHQIVSLIIVFVVVGVLAAIGFVAYSIAHDVGHHTRQKLEKKNVSFSRQGMKVGVKERTLEQQEDAAQSVITKIWNNSSWPGYKSRLGWGQGGTKSENSSSAARPSNSSRHNSSQANTSSAQVRPPSH
ncbi:hypothetical protein ABEF95_001763 [Exophiala dermatitidis]